MSLIWGRDSDPEPDPLTGLYPDEPDDLDLSIAFLKLVALGGLVLAAVALLGAWYGR